MGYEGPDVPFEAPPPSCSSTSLGNVSNSGEGHGGSEDGPRADEVENVFTENNEATEQTTVIDGAQAQTNDERHDATTDIERDDSDNEDGEMHNKDDESSSDDANEDLNNDECELYMWKFAPALAEEKLDSKTPDYLQKI